VRLRLLASASVVAALALPLIETPAAALYAAPPQSSHTTCVKLTGWLGTTRPGPHAQTFTRIFLRNDGPKACTLTGAPRLLYNEDVSVGVRLGLSAARANTVERGATVWLAAHSGVANVLLWVLPTTYWPVSRCQPTRILSARVEFGPNNLGAVVKTSFDACSKFASTTIAGIAAKTLGQ
jgi:hypothetical protein